MGRGRRSYLLRTVWDLRGAGRRPHTLHGQHVLQQLLAACGQTDRRTVAVRASAWRGSFTSDGQTGLRGKGCGKAESPRSQETSGSLRGSAGTPRLWRRQPRALRRELGRSSPSRGAFPGPALTGDTQRGDPKLGKQAGGRWEPRGPSWRKGCKTVLPACLAGAPNAHVTLRLRPSAALQIPDISERPPHEGSSSC